MASDASFDGQHAGRAVTKLFLWRVGWLELNPAFCLEGSVMQNQKMPESLIVPWIRWTARVLSWVWAPWALFWTLFVLGHLVGSGSIFGIAGFTFAVVVFPPLSLGAAFVASVWKNERVGGKMLLFDGVLMLALTAWVFDPHSAWVAITGFWTMVVPPLVAGALFLSCHRMSDSQQLHPTKRAGESGSPAVHR